MYGYKPQRSNFIGKDMVKVELADAPEGVEVYYQDRPNSGKNGRYDALCFRGKAQKPDMYYTYPSAESRQKSVDEWLKNLKEWADIKAQRAATKKAAECPFKVGDILTGSWGYDQTNPEAYEIVALSGRKVTLRELCMRTVPGSEGFMSETVKPWAGHYTKEEPITRIAQTYDGTHWYIKLHDSCNLSPASSDSTMYHSWYA